VTRIPPEGEKKKIYDAKGSHCPALTAEKKREKKKKKKLASAGWACRLM